MKTVICVTLLTMSSLLYSQNTLIEYDVSSSGNVLTSDLILNDSMSVLISKPDLSSNSIDATFFVKKYFENASYFNERFMNVIFYVKDSLHNMKWELTTDTSLILGEKCFSAKTHFRGRDYTAFYAPSYSMSEGPWKFGGLPGLILAVKSDDDFVKWSAVKIIKNYTGEFKIPKMNNYAFIGWDEYVKKFVATIDKWGKLARSNGTINSGTDAKVKMEATEIIYPQFQTGEGISF